MKHKGQKRLVIRHGHGPRRGCNAAEKAIETEVRREGKREVRAALTARDGAVVAPKPLRVTCTFCGRRRPAAEVMPDPKYGAEAPICRNRDECVRCIR